MQYLLEFNLCTECICATKWIVVTDRTGSCTLWTTLVSGLWVVTIVVVANSEEVCSICIYHKTLNLHSLNDLLREGIAEIESRRGGGGYIVVKKVTYNNEKDRLNIINNSIGERLTYSEGVSIIDNLLKSNLITLSEFEIIKISLNDRTLSSVEDKNKVRAELLKGMITVILS